MRENARKISDLDAATASASDAGEEKAKIAARKAPCGRPADPRTAEASSADEDALLCVRGLGVSYAGAPAVSGVSLSLAPGEILGVVGESGAGKSTVLAAIAGLLPADACVSGSILLDGEDLAAASEERLRAVRGARIATVFQNPASSFDPTMRIGAQIAELLRLARGLGRAEAKRESLALLERMRFADAQRVFRSYPFELSGGMQQRAAIALAMALDPELLLADEPTSALDATTQAAVLSELAAINRERGCAMVIVTHNIALALRMCARIAVMEGGRIVEEGAASTVVRAPRSDCARRLVAAVPRLER